MKEALDDFSLGFSRAYIPPAGAQLPAGRVAQKECR